MKTKAVLFTGIDTVAIGEVELPKPRADEVLIQTTYSGISPGTELRCLAGLQPDMGDWPIVPGYQATGRILARGSEVRLEESTAVFFSGTQRITGAGRLWGGHVAHAIVAASDVLPLASLESSPDAALIRLVAIALHGARLGAARPDENVVVIGLGPLGLLSARIHRLRGARVWGHDLDADRVKRARRGGLAAFAQLSELLDSLVHGATGGVDVVVDSTGVAPVLAESLRLLRNVPWSETSAERPRPRLLVQGSYPAASLPSLPYYELFAREAHLLVPRDSHADDLAEGLELLRSRRLKIDDLYDAPRAVADAPAVYAGLRKRGAEAPTAVFAW